MALPKYLAVNDRPVKFVQRSDGGLDVMALDMSTGEWEREPQYLDIYFEGGRDVDVLTEEQFNAAVAAVRERLGR